MQITICHLKIEYPSEGFRCRLMKRKGLLKQVEGIEARNKTKEAMPNSGTRSKILLHFMKGWISSTPMETIMRIPRELEYLEGSVKLVRRKKNEKTCRNQVATINNTPVVKRIFVNKNC